MDTEHAFSNDYYSCDRSDSNHARPDWKGDGWYRVTGQAGTKIIDFPVGYEHCATINITGWLSGGHPSPGEGVVTRKVCFKNKSNDCAYQADVDVLNCNNAYFVYYLVDVPKCYSGYCTK